MSRLRGVVGALLLLGVSLIASVLLVELGVRLVIGEQPKFPRHVVGASFGLRINEPYASYRHKSADVTVWFRINGQGMRSERDYHYEKPPGIKRIIVLGDSFAIGYEVAVEDTFSSVLERELRARGHRVEVLNAGVSGYGNAEAALYLERKLLRYEPNVVVISFFGNDLVDNARSALFRLEGVRLVEAAPGYVPAGRLGDFLNRNPIFNLLSERSDAFVLAKEQITRLVKRQIVKAHLEDLERAESSPLRDDDEVIYRRRLAAAILDRAYNTTHARNIPLIILSIPRERQSPLRLVEEFPLEAFDGGREGMWFLPAKQVLDPWLRRKLLYWKRSHDHWTPFSHRLVGEALAQLVLKERLLYTR